MLVLDYLVYALGILRGRYVLKYVALSVTAGHIAREDIVDRAKTRALQYIQLNAVRIVRNC